MKKRKEKWEQIGVVGIDSGTCWLGDCCYILHTDPPKELGEGWDGFCNILENEKKGEPLAKSFKFDRGHEGLGVCVSTGGGDGVYPVYAKYKNVKGWGKRITEVKIKFLRGVE